MQLLIFENDVVQKIKNPNYKGKWKTPWIDNPGMFMSFRRFQWTIRWFAFDTKIRNGRIQFNIGDFVFSVFKS